jgi:dolichol-phosphate mannosyltransferase
MRISVVVPVRNEEENIDPLIAEIHGALDGRVEFEVIYVDDGSEDGTRERLEAARRRYPRLRTLRHRRSYGQSAAIRTGVRAAESDLVVTLDGDGQNDPADIPKLLSAWSNSEKGEEGERDAGRRFVAGVRQGRRDRWLKRISSRFANAACRWLLRDETRDIGCGFRLFPVELFRDLPQFDHMHRFLPVLARRAGARVIAVEVGHRPRRSGRSKYGVHDRLWVGIVDLLGVAWLQRRASIPEIECQG